MANPRVSSPRVSVPENSHSYGPHHFSSRTSSYSSSNASHPFSTSAAPVCIPNSRGSPAPPPLPPPRYIEDLALGSDPGWHWGNSGGQGESGNKFGPTSPRSSISQGSWNMRKEMEAGSDDFGEGRRDSSTSTIRSPPRNDFDEGYHSLSGTSIAYQSVYSSLLLLMLSRVLKAAGVRCGFQSYILGLDASCQCCFSKSQQLRVTMWNGARPEC